MSSSLVTTGRRGLCGVFTGFILVQVACTPPSSGAADPADRDREPSPSGAGGSAPSRKDAAPAKPPEGGKQDAAPGAAEGHDAAPSPGSRVDSAGPSGSGSSDGPAPSANDAAVPPEPGALDPKDLAGVALWLDTSVGVTAAGGKVSRWEDQSGQNNHAFMDRAQYQPALEMDDKGRPFLRFTGKVDPKNTGGVGGPFLTIKDSPSMQWGKGDWMITTVAGYSNDTDHTHNGAFGTFFGKYGNRGEILFTGNWLISERDEVSSIFIGFGEGGAPGFFTDKQGFNDGKVRISGVRKKGNTFEIRVDGQVSKKRTDNAYTNLDVSFAGTDIGIGSFSGKDSIRCLKGTMYMMIAQRGALGDEDVAALEASLKKRFGL